MKKRLLYVLLMALADLLQAQDIRYTLSTRNSQCNGADNGQAQLTVVQVHPPYTYSWSSGNSGENVSGLAPADYSVIITDSTGRDTTVAFSIGEIPCELAAASVFTPNGDGIKDTWRIVNIEHYPDNHVLVFNRWGQKVFESSGAYEEWDGKDLLGVPAGDNSYFYIIYGDRKDEKSIIKGCVSIIR